MISPKLIRSYSLKSLKKESYVAKFPQTKQTLINNNQQFPNPTSKFVKFKNNASNLRNDALQTSAHHSDKSSIIGMFSPSTNFPHLNNNSSIIRGSTNDLASIQKGGTSCFMHRKNTVSINHNSFTKTFGIKAAASADFNNHYDKGTRTSITKKTISTSYNCISTNASIMSKVKSSSIFNTLKKQQIDTVNFKSITKKSNKFKLEELLEAIKKFSKLKVTNFLNTPLLTANPEKPSFELSKEFESQAKAANNKEHSNEKLNFSVATSNAPDSDANSPTCQIQNIRINPKKKNEEYKKTVKFLQSLKKDEFEIFSKPVSPARLKLSPVKIRELPKNKDKVDMLNHKNTNQDFSTVNLKELSNLSSLKVRKETEIRHLEKKTSVIIQPVKISQIQHSPHPIEKLIIHPLKFSDNSSDSSSKQKIESNGIQQIKPDNDTNVILIDQIENNTSQSVKIDQRKEAQEKSLEILNAAQSKESSLNATFNLEDLLMLTNREVKPNKLKATICLSAKSLVEYNQSSRIISNHSSSKDDTVLVEKHPVVELKPSESQGMKRKSNIKPNTIVRNSIKKTVTMLNMPKFEDEKPTFRHMSFRKTKTFLQNKSYLNKSFTDSDDTSELMHVSGKSSMKSYSIGIIDNQSYSMQMDNQDEDEQAGIFIEDFVKSIANKVIEACIEESDDELNTYLIPQFYKSAKSLLGENLKVRKQNAESSKKRVKIMTSIFKMKSINTNSNVSSLKSSQIWRDLTFRDMRSKSFSFHPMLPTEAISRRFSKTFQVYSHKNVLNYNLPDSSAQVELQRRKSLYKIEKITQKNLIKLKDCNVIPFKEYKSYLLSTTNKYFEGKTKSEIHQSQRRIKFSKVVRMFRSKYAKIIVDEVIPDSQMSISLAPRINGLSRIEIPNTLKNYFVNRYCNVYNHIVAHINKFKFHKRSVSNFMDSINTLSGADKNFDEIDFKALNLQNKLKRDQIFNQARDSCAKTHWFFQKNLLREAGFQFSNMKAEEKKMIKTKRLLTLAPQRLNESFIEEDMTNSSSDSSTESADLVPKKANDFKTISNFNRNLDQPTADQFKSRKIESNCKFYYDR